MCFIASWPKRVALALIHVDVCTQTGTSGNLAIRSPQLKTIQDERGNAEKRDCDGTSDSLLPQRVVRLHDRIVVDNALPRRAFNKSKAAMAPSLAYTTVKYKDGSEVSRTKSA